MAEPDLPADAPVADVPHPVEVHVGVPARVKGDVTTLGGGNSRRGERGHAHPPLVADQRLEHVAAAVAMPDLVNVLLFSHQRAELAQLVGDSAACLLGGEPVELRQRRHVHGAIGCDDADGLEAMAASDFVVGGVVCRRHLHCAGAELRAHRAVLDDRHRSSGDGQHSVTAYQGSPARVSGRNGHSSVAEHRLRPNGRNFNLHSALDRIPEVVELVAMLLPLDLLVADGGAIAWTPVDDAWTAVDQSLVIQRLEDDADRAHVRCVKREPRARPVTRVPEAAHLLVDATSVFLVPRVDSFLEPFPAQRLLARPLVGELALDDVLRRDGGVIRARTPFHLIPGHASLTAQGVLDGEPARVSHVQRTGDVRWWQRDDVGRPRTGDVSLADLQLLPPPAPTGLNAPGLEGFVHRVAVSIEVTRTETCGAGGPQDRGQVRRCGPARPRRRRRRPRRDAWAPR